MLYSFQASLKWEFENISLNTKCEYSIVYNEEKSNLEKAYNLYQRYIQTDAEFEINITEGLRSNYQEMFGNKSKWISTTGRQMDIGDLAEIFDKCNDINMELLSHSFVRFKRTKEWKSVVQAITSKQSMIRELDDDQNEVGIGPFFAGIVPQSQLSRYLLISVTEISLLFVINLYLK